MKKSLLCYALSAIFAATSLPLSAQAPQVNQTQVQNQLGFELIKQTINKSPTDKAIYQGIKLANGMTVLLISDEKANKSLMSLALPIGSMEDPVSQQGLAHYLEHMVLMGSKDFPETNGLDKFLSQNGGYNNASTAPHRTAYYFQVNNEAFDEGVARLADALGQPLLLESNAKKEVNAVNAEMVRAKSNDGWLLRSVDLATSNPAHPMTKFAVGNNETLSDKPDSKLQAELVKFYDQYYSANLMKAVLYSNQPIEKLAKLAESTLGKVKNKNLTAPSVDVPLYRDQDKGLFISYKPIQPVKLLSINFDYPNDEGEFKHKTAQYLEYVFSNNTEGTLSDYLIKNGLSDSGIQASSDPNTSRNRGDFSLYVVLTDKGLAEQDKIISLIFQQIELVKKAGAQPSYFNEIKESLSQSFQHLQIEKNARFIEGLADQMLLYPLENIIDSAYVVEEMDEKAIEAKLAGMTLDNARIVLMSDKAVTDKTTPYMQAGYSAQKFTNEQKARWLDFSKNPEIKLPELNPYFATDFSLNKVDRERTKPALIENGKGTKVYAMPSHYFGQEPKAKLLMVFTISEEKHDLKSAMAAALLNYMHALEQSKLLFQASVAGISADFTFGQNGAVLSLEGYTQHLQKLLENGLAKTQNFELTEATFAQAKQRMLEGIEAENKANSLRQATSVLGKITSFPYFEQDKRRAMVEELTLADVAAARERSLTQANGAGLLSVGNLSDEQVKSLLQAAEKVVKNANEGLNLSSYVDLSQVTDKVSYIQAVPHEDNALALSYFVQGDEEIKQSVQAGLVKDIIARWHFNDLRTEKQLGYVVYATATKVGKTSGLQFMVQSPNATPEIIMQHNQRFFKETWDKLQTLSDEEFEKYRASQLEKLHYKPESLDQEFGRYVADFSRGLDKFDTREQIIEALKAVSKQEVIDFYKQAVMEQKGFVLASQSLGTKATKADAAVLEGFKLIDKLEDYQKGLPRTAW
ncbi:pitrilysin [Pasteurellaceae bacterium RH1A]|nr:pitrilysin [Pasteurellaceae bacterium RH1A]